MKGYYSNPNIAHYATESELDTERKVFHCSSSMRPFVRGDVLDVGAGQGHITESLVGGNENVRSVLCIDFSEHNKRILSENGCAFRKVDLDQYPYLKDKKRFDTVISTDVIEHLFSPYLHLLECHRLLREGGWLCVSTPQASKTKVTVPHIQYFSPKSVELYLRRIGFREVIRIYNGILSSRLTRITSSIPLLRNILNNGCYFVAKK